jgi:hypothetical protein
MGLSKPYRACHLRETQIVDNKGGCTIYMVSNDVSGGEGEWPIALFDLDRVAMAFQACAEFLGDCTMAWLLPR